MFRGRIPANVAAQKAGTEYGRFIPNSSHASKNFSPTATEQRVLHVDAGAEGISWEGKSRISIATRCKGMLAGMLTDSYVSTNQLPTIMPEASSFALRSKGSVAGLVQSMIAIRSCANNCTLAATLIPTIRQDIPEGQSSCLQVLCLTSWQHRDDL